ncbi:Protein wings apart-like [Chionoecetes opilio]|uniref:Protein wings apart-like n=1 Tax=Chionoecetes opilio TaxID=41210 RepID=A0A8J4YQL3_CHIOP|nr:Protein wings apart-like [Chionoecetes opilio]
MGTGDFAEPRKSPPPLGSPGAAPGDGDTENFNLFGTDFDENEIVDRTSLDCGVAGGPLKDEGGLGDTQEMMEDFLFSTQGTLDPSQASAAAAAAASYQAYKPGHRSKSETEASKKLCHQPLVKKRSIFKSRDADRDAKKRATYTHKWHGHEEKDDSARQQAPVPPNAQGAAAGGSAFDEFDFEMPTSLKRVQTWPGSSADPNDSTDNQSVTSVKCAKSAKQYYTVVKNVKRTHQLQESGEFQEFNDDVEYFLDALRCSYPVPTRCLAALNLAQKCMVPSFRMHLRAHGTVIKFFSALSDAHSDHRLAICAATVMFTLSQDRLNMDLDRDSLELMLNLLDTDMDAADTAPCPDAAFLQQNNRKIRELCHDMQKKGHAKHLNLENINAGHLAMETLLSLTSKRAGEWFKEELRALGGVEHLVRTITLCTEAFTPHHHTHAWTHPRLEKLSKVDRCLKVLENVSTAGME